MWSQKLCLLAAACVLLVAIVDETDGKKGGGGGGRRRANRRNQEEELIEAGWTFTDCTPRTGTCGRGTKTGTLAEETKTLPCGIPCEDGAGNGRGGRRGGGRRGPGAGQRGAGAGCRYGRAPWSDCDPETDTNSRTLTLKNGGDECEQTKTVTKPCSANRKQARVKGCKYGSGEWSECVEGKRTLTRTLSEKSDAAGCEATKELSRPCTTKKGNSKCFFGKWTGYGDCNNGVKTKTRPLVDGGERCQKRAVKTKPC